MHAEASSCTQHPDALWGDGPCCPAAARSRIVLPDYQEHRPFLPTALEQGSRDKAFSGQLPEAARGPCFTGWEGTLLSLPAALLTELEVRHRKNQPEVTSEHRHRLFCVAPFTRERT